MKIFYEYQFHPVGQGLFCSGFLKKPEAKRDFAWVYDCGSVSGKVFDWESHAEMEIVDREIGRFRRDFDLIPERPRLDLVVVSHFDNDHISGLVRLLKVFSIGRLVLPYMPLWERLLIGCEETVAPFDDDHLTLMRFVANPTRFLSQQIDGANIEEIVYVLSGNEPPRPGEGGDPEPNTGDDPWRVSFDPPKMDREQPADLGANGNNSKLKIRFIESGSRILADNFWEFVPYNDQMVAVLPGGKSLEDFQADIDALANTLLNNPTDQALIDIKESYDARFGETSKPRNIISLFLYSGPLNHYRHHYMYLLYDLSHCLDVPCRCFSDTWNRHPSVLYTGDGYLKTSVQLTSLVTHMTPPRINNIGCLQVMHHGSKTNWHPGVASTLNPEISVFSSDPLQGNRHPHAEVLRDFWLHGPVQVDKTNGAYIRGEVRFR